MPLDFIPSDKFGYISISKQVGKETSKGETYI